MITLALSLLLTLSDSNNPKLTAEEAALLNTQFKTENFNFQGKYIGFTEVTSGAFYGIGKLTFTMLKKNFFRMAPEDNLYKLHILDSAEKVRTNGYDAIIVISSKKHKGKFKRLTREAVIKDSYNRYPQLPEDAGKDNDPQLSSTNAAFFNELYKYRLRPAEPAPDFTGKKIAIFDSYGPNVQQKSIAEYVQRVRDNLDQWGFTHTEWVYELNPQQKEESGGYDLIIRYRDKMGAPLSACIQQLRATPQTSQAR